MLSNKNKKDEIWRGIVSKAQQDGDMSLDYIAEAKVFPLYSSKWAIVAALFVCLLFASIWVYRNRADQQFLGSDELSSVYADAGSVSKLVLSNGDTILLDGAEGLDSNIAYLSDQSDALDFRKLEAKELFDENQLVETARGKQFHLILSDGTSVWLNASSRIVFPARFQADAREVSVEGEAYFEVAHNKKSPFVVTTGGKQVKVLGTHFNVRHYQDEQFQAITLLEGSVEVKSKSGADKSLVLRPSEQLLHRANHTEDLVQKLDDANKVISWRGGEFYFSDATPADIVRELQRWYPVTIVVQNQDRDKKISGRLKRTDSMKDVVDMFRFFDIELKVLNNN